MVKFYDKDGQRTLYISAEDLAQQWLNNYNKAMQDRDPSFLPLNPADPVQWLIQSIHSNVQYEKGRPYDMHDDPAIDPTMMSANIKGHGQVATEIRKFAGMNKELLSSNSALVKPVLPTIQP